MRNIARKICFWSLFSCLAIGLTIAGLFTINGLLLANGEIPVSGTTGHPPAPNSDDPDVIRILSYNIAKGRIYKGRLRFRSKQAVETKLKQMADGIVREKPHLIFLSEAVFECSPCPINQVVFLAEKTGMHSWVFGENYHFGLPFYRIVGGNAILSRFPLEPLGNPSLPGRQPFYITKNNRRVLWCKVRIRGQEIWLASVHNDSYSRSNNLIQTRQILDDKGNHPAVLAGDFNASPGEPSIELIRSTNEFTGSFDGPPTFPAGKANQKIDFIFAPRQWRLIHHRVIHLSASDHYPIVSEFRLPM